MEIEPEKFEKNKKDSEIFYKSIGEIYCPYLGATVSFNAKGLDHIKFKEWDKARSSIEQYVRLKLLRLAPEILKSSHTLQEYFETNRLERKKINARWEKAMVRVRYYGFVAIINGSRMKIIVKEVEGGQKFFWSIIPFWKNKRLDNGKNEKILHNGDLEIQ